MPWTGKWEVLRLVKLVLNFIMFVGFITLGKILILFKVAECLIKLLLVELGSTLD